MARALGVRAPSRRVPRAALGPLALCASALDLLRLARPPWTPEVLRTWGWYSYVDSSKAERELGYEIRPLEQVLARACS